MTEIYRLPIFGIAITLIAFFSARALRTKLKFVLFNPILIAITLIILFLVVLDIPFEDYNQGGKYLTFFLGPSMWLLALYFMKNIILSNTIFIPFYWRSVVVG